MGCLIYELLRNCTKYDEKLFFSLFLIAWDKRMKAEV